MREPNRPVAVLRNCIDISRRHTGDGDEAILFEVTETGGRTDPDAAGRILKQRSGRKARQCVDDNRACRRRRSTSVSTDIDKRPLGVAAKKALKISYPDISTRVCEHRADGYCRIRRGRERPKPVEAAIRGYPDAVFAVFEHHPDDVARQTIGAAKAIDACAMQMKHTRGRSDPECAVAILKDLPCQERLGRRREQKGCGPPSDKLRDAPIYDREEFAARAFDPGGTGIPGAKHERRIGPPSPSAILGPHPQLAPGVLEDGGHLSAPST